MKGICRKVFRQRLFALCIWVLDFVACCKLEGLGISVQSSSFSFTGSASPISGEKLTYGSFLGSDSDAFTGCWIDDISAPLIASEDVSPFLSSSSSSLTPADTTTIVLLPQPPKQHMWQPQQKQTMHVIIKHISTPAQIRMNVNQGKHPSSHVKPQQTSPFEQSESASQNWPDI